MKTTLNISDELLAQAMKLTRIKEKTALVNEALRVLIEKYARQRLIQLGGTDHKAKVPSRRRS